MCLLSGSILSSILIHEYIMVRYYLHVNVIARPTAVLSVVLVLSNKAPLSDVVYLSYSIDYQFASPLDRRACFRGCLSSLLIRVFQNKNSGLPSILKIDHLDYQCITLR